MVFDTADLEDAKVLLYQLGDSGAWCARSATTTIRLMHFCMEYGTGRRTLGEHCVRNAGVECSNPFCSTIQSLRIRA
jgi:hypothetical protein